MEAYRQRNAPLILIVDDNESNLSLVGTMLRESGGYGIGMAQNGKNALKAACSFRPDLILLDIMMPEMDGFEVCRRLKALPETAQIPVIFLTALKTEAEDIVRGFSAGGSDYVTKPFHKEELLARIQTHLSLKFEKEAYHNLVTYSQQGMAIVQDLRCVFANPALAELTGYSAENLKAMSREELKMLIHPEDRERVWKHLQNRIGGLAAPARFPARVLRKDGEIRWTEVYPVRIRFHGKDSVQITLTDNTREKDLEILLAQRSSCQNIIGSSRPMQRIYTLIEQLADSGITVLISGETGTGKELAADALRQAGPLREKPMIKINCAGLPETLFEAELFGCVKGAFTGADKDRAGFLQAAEGGILFLDEIGEMPLNLQAKLLRMIEYKEFTPLGSAHSRHADVRIVAATNADLGKKVGEGKFREDLWFRLKAARIHLPPLRARKEDIRLLTEHFIAEFLSQNPDRSAAADQEVHELFHRYAWPGNVRELKNAIEFACSICTGGILKCSDLPQELRTPGNGHALKMEHPAGTGNERLSEKEQILKALHQTRWHREKAARLLNMGRTTLYRKMNEYGIAK
ncbi:MAG: sigma-54-dependent Fis family transcriptional regulator [Desulfobacterales bacterium]